MNGVTPTGSIGTAGLLRIGVRLAIGTTARERFRPVAVCLSGAVAVLVLLHTYAATSASAALNLNPMLSIGAMSSLNWMLQLGVALPVLGLVATTARLSATVRDRRLARLRMLGLGAARTRVIAIGESGVLLLIGMVLGVLLYAITRSAVAAAWARAAEFPAAAYHASLAGWIVTLIGVPVAAVAISMAPVSRHTATAWQADRVGSTQRVIWRAATLAAGLGCLTVVLFRARQGSTTQMDAVAYAVGAALTVAGVLVTVPLTTRLVARALLALMPGPTTRIAARRLQHQPAAATQIVAALAVALFVLAIVAPLTSSFYTDPVARGDRVAATTGPQLLTVSLPAGADRAAVERVLHEHGVTRIELGTLLYGPGCAVDPMCMTAFVGTCWALTADRLVPGCDDRQTAWLDRRPDGTPAGTPIRLLSTPDSIGRDLKVNPPTTVLTTGPRPSSLEQGAPNLFVPASAAGVADWLVDEPVQLMVEGPGGLATEQRLVDAVRAVSPTASVITTRAFSNYVTTRNIVTALDAVRLTLLALGLLAFLLAGVDQVLARRASLISLLLLGVPRSTLRRAQLWESLLPLLLGLPAAIGLGFLTGATLSELTRGPASRWEDVLPIVGAAVVGTALAAIVVLVVAVPRISPDAIRQE